MHCYDHSPNILIPYLYWWCMLCNYSWPYAHRREQLCLPSSKCCFSSLYSWSTDAEKMKLNNLMILPWSITAMTGFAKYGLLGHFTKELSSTSKYVLTKINCGHLHVLVRKLCTKFHYSKKYLVLVIIFKKVMSISFCIYLLPLFVWCFRKKQ